MSHLPEPSWLFLWNISLCSGSQPIPKGFADDTRSFSLRTDRFEPYAK